MTETSSHESILIVEDNPDDAELAVIALHQKGINMPYLIARDGEEALDIALKRKPLPDQKPTELGLILLDLKLPGKNGIEVLKELRASPNTRYVPVVVLTTSMLEEDMIQSYENGANSFVRKPVDFATFLHYIELICHYWLRTNLRPASSISQR
jgi:two-component system response regulator